MRSAPTKANDNIITTIKEGAKINVTEVEEGWAKARYGKYSGYIMDEFLQEVE